MSLAATMLVGGCGVTGNRRAQIIAFGDSATAPDPDGSSYADFLAQELELEPGRIINEGQSGETAVASVERLRKVLRSSRYPEAGVLLYWEGGNDLADLLQANPGLWEHDWEAVPPDLAEKLATRLDEVEGAIADAIYLAKAEGFQVYVATYYHVREGTGDCPPLEDRDLDRETADRLNVYVIWLNERIRRAGAEAGAVVVDFGSFASMMRDFHDMYRNCLHLSAEGQAVVAEIFADAMEEFGD